MKKVVVVGGGESGVGAAILAKKEGYDVWLSDSGLIQDRYKEELISHEIDFKESDLDFDSFIYAQELIKSPGVPNDAPFLGIVKKEGVKVISEIEFGFRHFNGTLISVTGSNGKTTTSGLLSHLLRKGGLDAQAVGNIGKSFARTVAEGAPPYVVLELSSFQLDDIDKFKTDIAILLNITPDHLDQYEYDISKYAASKFKITNNQSRGDCFVYNANDALTLKFIDQFSTSGQERIGIKASDYSDGIPSKDGGYFEISLKGKHNLFNAMCAVTAARRLGLSDRQITMGLRSFINEAHRLETVGIINGVEYINDSKATNVEATYYALDTMTKPVIWIAGGTDKGNDYSALDDLVGNKVKALVCLGADNQKLINSFEDALNSIRESKTASDAVRMAQECASDGDVVLLSPACASFDLFKNYIDRGDQFKDAVWSLLNDEYKN